MVRVWMCLPSLAALASMMTAGFAPTLASAFGRQPQLVLQKEGRTEYHRPWCPVIRDGKGVLALTRGQAEARGLTSHADCEKPPSDEVFPPASGRSGLRRVKPAAPEFVYIDDTKYYHREKCVKTAGAAPRRTPLDVAGKTHWPCPVCRPPLRKRSGAAPDSKPPAAPGRGMMEP